ncbi:MAG: LCP family protein [Anaerolineales bacterium]|jgi:LCP family protein required for cell wall assembly
MTRTQKSILTVLSILAALLLLLVGWISYQTYTSLWLAPLGPAIALPTSTWSLPATWTPESSEFIQAQAPGNAATLAPSNTPVQALACGGPPVMTILAIGTDSRSDSYLYGLADVIRIVRVDFANPKVTILEFPRDLWVEIPEISDNLNGQDHEKLNQAYLYGNPGFGYYQGPGEGPGLLARTLALNFGVHSDSYVAVNMRTFEKIVDAVGGIKVNLPNGVDGRTAEDRSKRLIFPPGIQILNGEEALTLARIRNEGVFERVSHQNTVLCALQEKLTSPSVIVRIPALVNSFQGSVQTDLTPEQITQLGCLGTQLTGYDISFVSFPQEIFEGTRVFDPVFDGRIFVWDVDYDVLRDYVLRFNLGTWPAPDIAGESQADEETVSTCP